MKVSFYLFFLLLSVVLLSCGPERDAKEICACYDEVYRLKGEDGTKKMNECMGLLEKFTRKYQGTDDEQSFQAALTNCR